VIDAVLRPPVPFIVAYRSRERTPFRELKVTVRPPVPFPLRNTNTVWKSHWGLTRDPFAETESPYVSLPSHDEAVARLVFAVETKQRRAVFAAAGGLGKSTVLRKSFRELLDPRRRFITVSCPRDGTLLFTLLAERLGQRAGREPSRVGAWRALERAMCVASLQEDQVVVVIEDCDELVNQAVRRDLDSLGQLALTNRAGLTIIQLESTGEDAEPAPYTPWALRIGLQRLTRSEAERYLTTKMSWAGSADRLFTPRAMTRIHALSLGVPRVIEHLASMCLMGGAVRRLEVINPELVDAIALECWPSSLVAST
jgi:type II secretory pathway predicted ATPase ExeA